MAYYANSFIYDGIPSEQFNLFICNVGDGGLQTESGGGNVKIHTDKTPLMDRSYLLGVEYNEAFEFTLTFASIEQKDRLDISLINNWLIGRDRFCKLQIMQPDMESAYYNCIMKDFKITTFGNLPFAFECKVVCDRGWTLENIQPFVQNIIGGTSNFTINNTSHTRNITLPVIEFRVNKALGNVSIINQSNKNYETKLTSLTQTEVITMDSNLELITSSLELKRLGNFNKHWFELVPNINNISVVGDIDYLKISYDNIRKLG